MTRTILIVDDEADLRALMTMSLELVGGHQVVATGSPQEALEIVARERLDAVLMDVQMPDMDGPTLLDAMRDRRPDLPPVVFITASVQESELAGLADLAVAGVMQKPFDPMTMPQELATLLGWDL